MSLIPFTRCNTCLIHMQSEIPKVSGWFYWNQESAFYFALDKHFVHNNNNATKDILITVTSFA